jgi:hypothetical protein
LPDLAGGDTHPVAYGRTNTKGIPFNKALEFVHIANLEKIARSSKTGLERQPIFRTFAPLLRSLRSTVLGRRFLLFSGTVSGSNVVND